MDVFQSFFFLQGDIGFDGVPGMDGQQGAKGYPGPRGPGGVGGPKGNNVSLTFSFNYLQMQKKV